MTSTDAASSPVPVARWAAAASWVLPLTGLSLVGFSDKGRAILAVSDGTLIAIAAATALAGLVAGAVALVGGAARSSGTAARRAIVGTGASAVVLVTIALAAASGAGSGRRTAEDVQREIDAAMRDYPGWNGARALGGPVVLASELDAASDLARRLLRSYDAPFRIVLFSVDNRAGSREVLLDVDEARLLAAHGPATSAVTPAQIGEHLVDPAAAATFSRLGSVRVPPGARFDGVQAFFPAGTSLRDVRAIEVRVDGVARAVPGRFFTLEDKRAVDASRKGPAPPR